MEIIYNILISNTLKCVYLRSSGTYFHSPKIKITFYNVIIDIITKNFVLFFKSLYLRETNAILTMSSKLSLYKNIKNYIKTFKSP